MCTLDLVSALHEIDYFSKYDLLKEKAQKDVEQSILNQVDSIIV